NLNVTNLTNPKSRLAWIALPVCMVFCGASAIRAGGNEDNSTKKVGSRAVETPAQPDHALIEELLEQNRQLLNEVRSLQARVAGPEAKAAVPKASAPASSNAPAAIEPADLSEIPLTSRAPGAALDSGQPAAAAAPIQPAAMPEPQTGHSMEMPG